MKPLMMILFALILSGQSLALDFDSSPYNYKNSSYNYDNSSYNYKNSPYNYENSEYNTNSHNGVYNEAGERIGYGVKKQDGGINYFDNEGKRTGYQPADN